MGGAVTGSTLEADTKLHDAVAEAHDVSWARARLTLAHVGRSLASSVVTALFLVVAAGWPVFEGAAGGGSALAAVSPLVVAACVVAYAVAASVEFEVGPGFAVPTTPVLAAALFLLPPALVPLLVLAGLTAAATAQQLIDRERRDTVAALAVSSWHAVGPALVFALWAPADPRLGAGTVALYAAALTAQVAFDVAAAWIHNCWDLGVPTGRLHESFRFTVVVDVLLAPLGLVAVAAAGGRWWSPLLLLPTVGLLWLMQRDRRRYVDRSVALANAYRDTAAEARTDPLTGLGNRMAWHEALDEIGSTGGPCGVVLLDIDGLKRANDHHGHDTGDRLISAVARVVEGALVPGARAARIGGDEFAVVLPGSATDETEAFARRLRRALADAEPLAAGLVPVAASVGWSIADPGDGDPPAALAAALARADQAVNADKIVRGARRS